RLADLRARDEPLRAGDGDRTHHLCRPDGTDDPRGGRRDRKDRRDSQRAQDPLRPGLPPGSPGPDAVVTAVSATARASISCVVADDHPAVLESLARVLVDAGYDVVGQARDGETAASEIAEHEPTVAILDMRIPGLNGVAT